MSLVSLLIIYVPISQDTLPIVPQSTTPSTSSNANESIIPPIEGSIPDLVEETAQYPIMFPLHFSLSPS